MTPDLISLCLVDDHAIVRNGLKALIEKLGNYQVTYQYDNGQELLNAIPFNNPPAIIIMDLSMPVMDGTATMRELKNRAVNIPVLILTLETDEEKIINLFRLGIRGYLPKTSTAQVLSSAINDLLTSGYYHNEMMTKALMADHVKHKSEKERVLEQVTEREKEFLRLVCDESEPTYEQIATTMNVSRRTVDGYREALFQKFNIRSKTGLVLFALKYGIEKLS